MGSAVGAAYLAAGSRVVTTVAGRSARTSGLAEQAGLELLPDLDAVVAESELVLSIVPPGEAGATAAAIAAAAGRTGSRPLVADWNAVSPATVQRARSSCSPRPGLELVDGSISGGPPRADYRTRVYLSGRSAAGARRCGAALDRRPDRRRHGRARVRREDVHGVDVQGLERAACARAPDRTRARRAAPGARRPRRLVPATDRPRSAPARGLGDEGRPLSSARCGRSPRRRQRWASRPLCSRRWPRFTRLSRGARSPRRHPRRSRPTRARGRPRPDRTPELGTLAEPAVRHVCQSAGERT